MFGPADEHQRRTLDSGPTRVLLTSVGKSSSQSTAFFQTGKRKCIIQLNYILPQHDFTAIVSKIRNTNKHHDQKDRLKWILLNTIATVVTMVVMSPWLLGPQPHTTLVDTSMCIAIFFFVGSGATHTSQSAMVVIIYKRFSSLRKVCSSSFKGVVPKKR